MTIDKIISMAREAGCAEFAGEAIMTVETLERFAALVAAAEREACAKAAADFLTSGRSPLGRSVAAAILARGNP